LVLKPGDGGLEPAGAGVPRGLKVEIRGGRSSKMSRTRGGRHRKNVQKQKKKKKRVPPGEGGMGNKKTEGMGVRG